jgi:hypothetical protein
MRMALAILVVLVCAGCWGESVVEASDRVHCETLGHARASADYRACRRRLFDARESANREAREEWETRTGKPMPRSSP